MLQGGVEANEAREGMLRKYGICLIGLASAAVLVAGCGSSKSGSSQAQGSGGSVTGPASLTFIFPNSQPTLSFYPYYVARDLGYYKSQNLSVNFVGSDGGSQAEQQIIAGRADAGSPAVTSSLTASGKGYPVQFVYSFSTGSNFGVFVKADSSINSVADLKGTTIGITNASGGEVPILNSALGSAGVSKSSVKEVAIGDGGPVTFEALSKGTVAAYATSYTSEATLLAAGLQLRDITPPEFQSFPAFGITTTTSVLKSKREALARFARAVAQATYFCQSSPAACKAIMQKDGPQQWTNPKLGTALLNRIIAASKVSDAAQFGAINIDSFSQYQKFAQSTDPTYKSVDLSKFLNSDLVAQANTFDHVATKAAALAYK
jgi:ABC-type nitrate/sulfonate/bicarbonate transport system substrate-binding protein